MSTRDDKGRFLKSVEEPPAEEAPSAVPEEPSEPEQPRKKVAIIGYTSSRDLAPWGDPEWEIWVCNNLPLHLKPGQEFHRVYDLHPYDTIESDERHTAFLRGETVKSAVDGRDISLGDRPVLVWNARPEWPTSWAYPKDGILDAFKDLAGGHYLTNSIAWMTAHAVAEGVSHLSIFGVDMAQGTEYAAQRPSCEWWLGFAEGLGIKVYIPPTSDLLKCNALYGAEDDSFFYAKAMEREKELRGRIAAVQQQQAQLAQHERELLVAGAQLQGGLETTSYFRAVMTNPRANRDGSAKEV